MIAIIAGPLLCYFLWRDWQRRNDRSASSGEQLYRDVKTLLDRPEIIAGQANGSWKLYGNYRNAPFQFQTVTDTLSTRKLPVLLLMVTLPKPQKVSGTVDMMMRSAAASTFSNFDFLPYTMQTPSDFPKQAVLRSDKLELPQSIDAIRSHLANIETWNLKELLVSPHGLRIVVMLAEADRSRYGVFREADFGNIYINGKIATEIMDALWRMDRDFGIQHG